MAPGKLIARFGSSFFDLLFPIECVGCGKQGVFLCQSCVGNITLTKNFNCPFCGRSCFLGESCFSCRNERYLDGVWVAAKYDVEVLRRGIKALKYKSVKNLANPLSEILINFLHHLQLNFKATLDFDILIPVPLHKRKILSRGFNQSELLAQGISAKFGLPVLSDILCRKKFTRPQVNLKREKRSKNVAGVFCLNARIKYDLAKKKILLIDDVLTTGSTLEECARVLKKAGVKKVWGLVLAKN